MGGRCAGSSTALLLARKGYRVLVLDLTNDREDGELVETILRAESRIAGQLCGRSIDDSYAILHDHAIELAGPPARCRR